MINIIHYMHLLHPGLAENIARDGAQEVTSLL